jgi:hypothetical protein
VANTGIFLELFDVLIFGAIESTGQGKRIFFLGAQPGDKNFLQTDGVFLC